MAISKEQACPEVDVPAGDWIGVDVFLPGTKWKSVRVRLSKKGQRCVFIKAKYVVAEHTWYNRQRDDVEVGGWSVTQWFCPATSQ